MERATGMALHQDKVDIFAARYPDTGTIAELLLAALCIPIPPIIKTPPHPAPGTLLCHDDRLEGRRIAFILYLTPDWQPGYGGGLDLFGLDAEGGPGEILRTVVPAYNTLAFFRVSARSYHQVAEVTAPGRERWSVTGWYHAKDTPAVDVAATPRIAPALPWTRLLDTDALGPTLDDWLNPDYLRCGGMYQFRLPWV